MDIHSGVNGDQSQVYPLGLLQTSSLTDPAMSASIRSYSPLGDDEGVSVARTPTQVSIISAEDVSH